jgi:uncharacterized membrane protein HdeD (DUF308 family)
MASQRPSEPFDGVPEWRPDDLPPDLRALLWAPIATFGVGSAAIGVLMVLWPHVTLAVAAVLLGLQLLIHGLFRMIQAAGSAAWPTPARVLVLAIGLLSVIVGILCVVRVTSTIYALGLLVGVYWIASGIAHLFLAAGGHGGDRLATVLMGVLGIVAGLVVVAWPGETLTALTIVLGCWLIVLGLLALGTAWRLRAS